MFILERRPPALPPPGAAAASPLLVEGSGAPLGSAASPWAPLARWRAFGRVGRGTAVAVVSLAWASSGLGRVVAAGGGDGSVGLWSRRPAPSIDPADAAGGWCPVARFEDCGLPCHALAFAPPFNGPGVPGPSGPWTGRAGGRAVAAGFGDGRIRIYAEGVPRSGTARGSLAEGGERWALAEELSPGRGAGAGPGADPGPDAVLDLRWRPPGPDEGVGGEEGAATPPPALLVATAPAPPTGRRDLDLSSSGGDAGPRPQPRGGAAVWWRCPRAAAWRRGLELSVAPCRAVAWAGGQPRAGANAAGGSSSGELVAVAPLGGCRETGAAALVFRLRGPMDGLVATPAGGRPLRAAPGGGGCWRLDWCPYGLDLAASLDSGGTVVWSGGESGSLPTGATSGALGD